MTHALADLDQALALDPKSAAAFQVRGVLHNRKGEYEQAINDLDLAISYDEHSIRAFIARGNAYLALGNPDKAIGDYTSSLKLGLNPFFSLYNRARAYLAKNDYERAIADLNEALQLSPNGTSALVTRAQAYEGKGELDKALADYVSVLKLVPDHALASAGKIRVERKLGAASGKTRQVGEPADGRVALVIGNSQYRDVQPLPNPQRDAALIADELKRVGFKSVHLLVNASRTDIARAMNTFARESARANWAVIYYAGHGMELNGSNYLVPVDATLETDDDIPKQTIALDAVLDAVSPAKQLRLVLLDACRDNPFAAEMHRNEDAGSVGRGLARIEPETGTLVAFATKHGHVAIDGAGEDLPFAVAIAKEMETPGLEITRFFRLVHDDVVTATKNAQEPFTYGQLSATEFYFKGP